MKKSKLDSLKQRLRGNHQATVLSEFYILAKELKCLPELIGREYEFTYDKEGKIKGFKQLPMNMSSYIMLIKELQADYKRQEKASKQKTKGRKR